MIQMLQLTQQKYNYMDGEEAEVWDEVADDITHQSKLFCEIVLSSPLGTFSLTLSLSTFQRLYHMPIVWLQPSCRSLLPERSQKGE